MILEETARWEATRWHWTAGKVTAVLIVLGYAGIGFSFEGAGGVLKTLAFCLLPLAAILFPDEIAAYKGFARLHWVDRESHPKFILVVGWFILLLPVIFAIIFATLGVEV